MLSPLRLGMRVNFVLEVVAEVVAHFDACRSSDELNLPEDLDPLEAARTAVGTHATKAATIMAMSIFRMSNLPIIIGHKGHPLRPDYCANEPEPQPGL